MFTRISKLALLAILSLRGYAQTATCDREYEVQLGDYCDLISSTQGSSTYQLAASNVGVINPDCSNLVEGEVICLGLAGKDCTTNTIVQTGQGCWDIAQAAGITNFTVLFVNNPNVNEDCTNIYPGEVLCVAAEAVGY